MKEDIKHEECKISLGLALGLSHDNKEKSPVQLHILFPPRQKEEEEEEVGQQQTKRSRGDDREEEDFAVQERVGDGMRKKLRLTQEQAALLEDTFREHNTLCSFQKQELAAKLNLRPRQVEVWFQNRRARNKLKQTEEDFRLLKKWCEALNEENRRLKKELQEIKQQTSEGSKLHLDLPKTASGSMTLSLCSSCGRTKMDSSKKSSSSGDSSIAC